MKSTPHVPDELIMIDRQFSWRTAYQVCKWWFVAFLISAVCEVIFPEMMRQWSRGLRITVVIAEFVALALFARDAAKFVREQDELQRRITQALLFFSTTASFFTFVLWFRLEREGFFHAVFGPPFMNNTWGIYSVAHVCMLLGGYYGLGFVIFKRRYK